MKRNGKTLDYLAKGEAVIPRPGGDIKFDIQALPRNFVQKLEDMLPTPKAPYITTKKKGKVERSRDYEDSHFIEALKINTDRKSALIFYEALKADKTLQWEIEGPENAEAHADSIIKELDSLNLSDGDFNCLTDQIAWLSNNSEGHVQEARNRFLSNMNGETEDGDSPSSTQ